MAAPVSFSRWFGLVATRAGLRGKRLVPVVAAPASSPRTTEEQDIAVVVLYFETSQAVIIIFQRCGKLNIARSKFGGQSVRIGDIHVCVPARPAFAFVVGKRINANVLEHDHRF